MKWPILLPFTLATLSFLQQGVAANLANRFESFRDCDNCPEMIAVGPGVLQMGSPSSEAGRNEGESLHSVRIAKPFAVGKYDVTVAEFARFASETGFNAGEGGCFGTSGLRWANKAWRTWNDPGFRQTERDPVVCLTWDETQAFVSWLSKKSGKFYRLLTEAEWEYAARGGVDSAHPWGALISHQFANYGGGTQCCATRAEEEDHWEYTSPVGSFPPNAFGLYDMLGNVWQWIEDCSFPSYQSAPVDGSARHDGDCGRRMRRGGGWIDFGSNVRSAARFWIENDHRSADGGFRVARDF